MPGKEPIDLVISKGKKHLTKAEIAQRKREEVRAKKNGIKPPDYLNIQELQRFNFYVEEMIYSNIIANLDVTILARHVQNEIEFERIAPQLSAINPLDPEYEKLFKPYDKLYRNLLSSSNVLGFNIVSRCKIQLKDQAPEVKQNKFNKFMG